MNSEEEWPETGNGRREILSTPTPKPVQTAWWTELFHCINSTTECKTENKNSNA